MIVKGLPLHLRYKDEIKNSVVLLQIREYFVKLN